ncbi:hypothetical protein BZG36_02875 [Bifiguratus adelaidae]|uniref:Phospholipid-transporting ATPase n=1 Tax=Bifiguratus adelaidae TaxID=1938954 RepID=A0A261Y224_9FUNG|nr:hypothetical protein BZG36_02875 [Bifiguratus adelaidae]
MAPYLGLDKRQTPFDQTTTGNPLTPTDDQKVILYIIGGYIAGIIILWHMPILKVILSPFKLLTVGLHEFSHAAVGCCTCAHIDGIEIDPDEGGVTRMRGGIQCLTLPAGYLGSSLIGALLVFCGFDIMASKIASIALGVCLLVTLWWARNWLTRGIGLFFCGLIVFLWWLDHGMGVRYFVLFVGVMSCLYCMWDILDDLVFRKAYESDASKFAQASGGCLPSQAWGVIWFIISIAFMVCGILAGLATFKPTKPSKAVSPFPNNKVFTAKYTVFTFLPKFLFEEFSKYANLFFLFISGIQQIPGISPTSRWTTLAPLVIVLFITAIKEIFEDYGVHKSDAEVNARQVQVLDREEREFRPKAWQELQVGDIVRLESGQSFPADLILLSSSEPEGICFIETSNLDGEVNLKIKQALSQTAPRVDLVSIQSLKGHITSESPNNRLYNYDGTLTLYEDPDAFLAEGISTPLSDTASHRRNVRSPLPFHTPPSRFQSPVPEQGDNYFPNRLPVNDHNQQFTSATISQLSSQMTSPQSMDNDNGHGRTPSVTSRGMRSSFRLSRKRQSVISHTEQTYDYSLDPSQLLLRGAQLRNTAWIMGIVVFTGHETKLLLNSRQVVPSPKAIHELILSCCSKKPSKTSNITKITNRNILYLFFSLLIMSIACAAGKYALTERNSQQLSYIGISTKNARGQFGLDILTFMILFNSFIPISLMVTMEIVKYILCYLIDTDLDLYYPVTDTPATARSSSLVEELGQVEYVFSDKTGTLTCNQMDFRQCSIAGSSYGDPPSDIKPGDKGVQGSGPDYHWIDLQDHLQQGGHESRYIHEFLTLLTTCHTVIPEQLSEEKQNAQKGNGKTVEKDLDLDAITYQASSPDEAALVKGARDLGYTFHTRKADAIMVRVGEKDLEYQVLNICEFNSTRKRMSAIIRKPDGRITLYCKGADTVILERLAGGGIGDSVVNPYVEATLRHLEEYASEGLRTLCIAMRDISPQEYESWSHVYNKAATTLQDRAQKLDDAAELIEKDLMLLGATAIEDKLQDGVPETIATLQEAGIKVWVLTGDRQETAINIGFACRLLSDQMDLLIAEGDGVEGVGKWISNQSRKLEAAKARGETHVYAVVIDGKALTAALEEELEKGFLNLARQCKAVICCRVSPLQKALVVRLVKKFEKSITLAIGDGANDVPMIQAAHVGVGISGVEGLQAARAADFSISQFRFLRKLLLVHGAWAYERLSKMIFFYFYKNVALYLTQFWYAIFNGFSGQTLYESWTMSCFNVVFTILPPFVIGVFDQYLLASMLDRYPQLYMLGQANEFFSEKRFWGWFANAVFHSALLFFIGLLAFRDDIAFYQGWTGGLCRWNKFNAIAIGLSLVVWFAFLPVVTYVGYHIDVFTEYHGIIPRLYGNLQFWIYIIAVPLMVNLRDFVWKYLKRMYFPRPYHIVQELELKEPPNYRPNQQRWHRAMDKVHRLERQRTNSVAYSGRGYAFAQSEERWQGDVCKVYGEKNDTGSLYLGRKNVDLGHEQAQGSNV